MQHSPCFRAIARRILPSAWRIAAVWYMQVGSGEVENAEAVSIIAVDSMQGL
jgi:hypothetical protein